MNLLRWLKNKKYYNRRGRGELTLRPLRLCGYNIAKGIFPTILNGKVKSLIVKIFDGTQICYDNYDML